MVEPSSLKVGEREYSIFRIDGLENAASLPYTLRILLENVARAGSEEGIAAVTGWEPHADPSREIAFSPSRVLLQDLTGVPAVVDLAAMRDALAELGGDPARINPLQPVELVVDHSIQVDSFGSAAAFHQNEALDYERNDERYAFLKWGQQAFANFKVVPPNMGICHQVNLEFLARVVFGATDDD